MSAPAASVPEASRSRTVDPFDGPVALRGPPERAGIEPEELLVPRGSDGGVADQAGGRGGVLAQPALADERREQGCRSPVRIGGECIDIGCEQVGEHGRMVIADQRQVDRPLRGIVERQRSGDPGRHARRLGERLRPLRERKPCLRRHRPRRGSRARSRRRSGRRRGASSPRSIPHRAAARRPGRWRGRRARPGRLCRGPGRQPVAISPETIAPSRVSRGSPRKRVSAVTGSRP